MISSRDETRKNQSSWHGIGCQIQGFIQDFWLGGGGWGGNLLVHQFNEARKYERRGLGASPSLAFPPPRNFDKLNAYAHQG